MVGAPTGGAAAEVGTAAGSAAAEVSTVVGGAAAEVGTAAGGAAAEVSTAAGGAAEGWWPDREAAVPVWDLRAGCYVHTRRPRKAPAPADDAARRGEEDGPVSHHGVRARRRVRPTFARAERRPFDGSAPPELPRRGKIPPPSAQACAIAADALHAARVSMLVPVVPTCDDMNPRGHDRGPIVINAPFGGPGGCSWAAALRGGTR